MPPKPYLDPEKVQQQFPDIRKLELFDVGGQKIVYKGVHSDLGTIMLKFFKTNEADPRIAREIAIAERLKHKNLPILYSAGSIQFDNFESKVVYLLEEYIEGETLRAFMGRGSVSLATCKYFLEVMFSVLQVLQENSLVHRDLKPDNIMVRDGSFFILDFGIARELGSESITDTSASMGPHTLGYAPWEQINNEKDVIGEKTDLFSIAVICQEMLTGEHPFIVSASGSIDAMQQTRNLQIKSLGLASSVNDQLEEFLHSLMSKLPSSRPTLQQTIEWFNEFKEQMI